MIIDIHSGTLHWIKTKELRDYAGIYINAASDFIQQIEQMGMKADTKLYADVFPRKIKTLQEKGAILRNHCKSIYLNRISPACEACQTGVGSATYFISLKCSRKCFYCFNPNQEEYQHFSTNERDCTGELKELLNDGYKLAHVALTGGEPLLHKRKMLNFYQTVNQKSSDTYTRLYTSGDFIDREILTQLRDASLKEIRFSVKLEDSIEERQQTLHRIALAQEYIPNVLVEMPMIPGQLNMMKDLLLQLDELQIFSINLLEFCFPYYNIEEFQKRAYKIKNPPFKVLYNYWYAGGLPVSESEMDCLELLDFSIEKKLNIGVHYCSLENKLTGQIYQQNFGHETSTMYFSPKDYFLKTAKVFGKDINRVKRILGSNEYELNKDYNYVQFNPKLIRLLRDEDIEVGLSKVVMEEREDGTYLRELQVDLINPADFDMNLDM